MGTWDGEETCCQDCQLAVENEGDTVTATPAMDCVLSVSSVEDGSTSPGVNVDMVDVIRSNAAGTEQRRTGHKKARTTKTSTNDRRLRLCCMTRRITGTVHGDSTAKTDNSQCLQTRDKNASRRERKATKTLAIVLGVYLTSPVSVMLRFINGVKGFRLRPEGPSELRLHQTLTKNYNYIYSCPRRPHQLTKSERSKHYFLLVSLADFLSPSLAKPWRRPLMISSDSSLVTNMISSVAGSKVSSGLLESARTANTSIVSSAT